MLLVLSATDTFEVELGLLHLDDWVLDICETNGQDDVFWSLGPHTSGRGNPATHYDFELKMKIVYVYIMDEHKIILEKLHIKNIQYYQYVLKYHIRLVLWIDF